MRSPDAPGAAPGRAPRLSVVIPTRNRAPLLDACLQSLAAQSLPTYEFEVIVVDNGSSDDTARVAASHAARLQLRSEFVDVPGLHAGRHAGMRLARSDLLVFGDDDILASPTWLSSILAAFEDPTVALVGGNDLPMFEVPPPAWLSRWWDTPSRYGRALPHLSILDFGEGRFEIPPRLVWGCNFSIRREALVAAGGFHPDALPRECLRWRGDGETHVSDWIRERGLRAVFDSGASVRHRVSAERMTREYVIDRSYAQGISDSYADIRAGRRPWRSMVLGCRRRARVALARGRRALSRHRDPVAAELCEIQASGLAAWRAGYDFHQAEVRSDPSLLAWVMQEDYL